MTSVAHGRGKTLTEWEHLARPQEEGETSLEYWHRIDRLRDKPVGEKPVGLVDVSRWSFMTSSDRRRVPRANRWRIRWFVAQGWVVMLASIGIFVTMMWAVGNPWW